MPKHQDKSGSKSNRDGERSLPLGRMRERPDGSRVIKLNAEGLDLMIRQRQAFEDKFGRPPGSGDPVFFDPSANTPVPLTREKISAMRREAARAMVEAGILPEVAHAFERTGLLPTEATWDQLSAEERRRWKDAIDHYFAAGAMADEALRAGAHPAIVYAIRKTGTAIPKNLEINGNVATVSSDEDEEWLRYMNEFAEIYPELCTVMEPTTSDTDKVH